MTFRVCAILPSYKHVAALEGIVERLRERGLGVVVVDDGNAPDIANEIAAICGRHERVALFRREINGGKGAAVLDGLRYAVEQGFTHGLQIDADGQHDLSNLTELIEVARREPDALVTGKPIFDESVPRGRLMARWITHIWVSINTLSPKIIDTMCGIRIYPIAETLSVARHAYLALRMGFDTEIVVRMVWQGVVVRTVPVRVIYPEGNYSNFALKENIEVSAMHARLFFEMLVRAPRMLRARLWGKPPSSQHWASLSERGSAMGLRFLAIVYRLFGRRICLAIMSPIILFFFLSGGTQRRASLDYLERVWKSGGFARRPGWIMSLRHFMSFGAAALDKLAAWTGNIPIEEIDGAYPSAFDVVREGGKGALILTAHLGNPEVIRAIGSLKKRARVNVLVHTIHALKFNALIETYSKDSTLRMIQVTEVGPDTAIILQTALSNGEIIVIVGDRIPVSGATRVSWVDFLGAPAPFAQGPHILAAILKCPVYLLFCVRDGARHRVFFEHFSDRIELPRKNREAEILVSVQRYAKRLEHFVRMAPLQWFNFYDYWRPNGLVPPDSFQSSKTDKVE